MNNENLRGDIFSGIKEEQITVNGLNVSFKSAGHGKTILILHGWGSSSDSWKIVISQLSENGYNVICPDLPGFGKSAAPPIPWNVDDYKNWVIDFMVSLGIEKFFLLGHSFGGRISIKLCSVDSGAIKKLILCNSAGLKIKPDIKTRFLMFLNKTGKNTFSPGPAQSFFKNILYFFIRKRDYPKVKGVMRATMKNIIAEDLEHYLSHIKTETLIIWGEKDRMVPLKCAYVFEKQIKKSKLIVMPAIGHSPHLEDPEGLVRLIEKFFI